MVSEVFHFQVACPQNSTKQRIWTITITQRSFTLYGPTVYSWNSLPSGLSDNCTSLNAFKRSQRVDLVVLTFHWLPDGKRINCKIALHVIVCKSQHFVMLLILLSRPSPLYGDDYSSTSVIQNYKMIPCRCLLLLLLLFQRSAVSFWKYSFRLFIHFFCWRPLLLIPSTWQWSALASNLSSSILDTMCPNHIAFCSTLHRPAV